VCAAGRAASNRSKTLGYFKHRALYSRVLHALDPVVGLPRFTSRLQSSEEPIRRNCWQMRLPYCSFHFHTSSRNFSRPRSCLCVVGGYVVEQGYQVMRYRSDVGTVCYRAVARGIPCDASLLREFLLNDDLCAYILRGCVREQPVAVRPSARLRPRGWMTCVAMPAWSVPGSHSAS
jgi:hypothetical protein